MVTVAEGASLDFESAESHIVTVKVTDSAGHELSESFEIQVSDENEAVSDLSLSGGSVAENAAAGTVVGTASAADPDNDETFAYELTGDADGRFEIDPETGVVTVAEGASLDFESSPTHTVTVKVTDSAGNSREETFTIHLSDQYDTPELDQRGQVEIAAAVDNSVSDRTDERIDSEQRLAEQSEPTEEPAVDGPSADVGRPSGEFVPFADVPDWTPDELPDWKRLEFGEVVQVNAINGDSSDADIAAEYAPRNAEDELPATAGVDSIEAAEAPSNPGMLAKLWGFARAFRGVSDSSGGARHQRR